jgi:hypothetical protein
VALPRSVSALVSTGVEVVMLGGFATAPGIGLAITFAV